jgi:hypothetical protein
VARDEERDHEEHEGRGETRPQSKGVVSRGRSRGEGGLWDDRTMRRLEKPHHHAIAQLLEPQCDGSLR